MKRDSRVGELRAWNLNAGRIGTFLVIGIEDLRIDVILPDGKREGFFKPYLEGCSHAISYAIS